MGSYKTSGAPFFVTWFPTVSIGDIPNSDAVADWIQGWSNVNDGYVSVELNHLINTEDEEVQLFSTPELHKWVEDFKLAFPENEGIILVHMDY